MKQEIKYNKFFCDSDSNAINDSTQYLKEIVRGSILKQERIDGRDGHCKRY